MVWIYGEIILIVICIVERGSNKVWKCRKDFWTLLIITLGYAKHMINSVKIRAIKIILGNISPMCTQRQMTLYINTLCEMKLLQEITHNYVLVPRDNTSTGYFYWEPCISCICPCFQTLKTHYMMDFIRIPPSTALALLNWIGF